VFIGAFKYVADSSDGFANEPSSKERAEVLRRVNRLEWHGETPREWLRDTGEPPSSRDSLVTRRRRKNPRIYS
jgi:hypothetical protein